MPFNGTALYAPSSKGPINANSCWRIVNNYRDLR